MSSSQSPYGLTPHQQGSPRSRIMSPNHQMISGPPYNQIQQQLPVNRMNINDSSGGVGSRFVMGGGGGGQQQQQMSVLQQQQFSHQRGSPLQQQQQQQLLQQQGQVGGSSEGQDHSEDKQNAGGGGGGGQQQQQQQQATTPQTSSQAKEINTATVCRIGQETVQEIVSRIQEVFSYLKSLQPPVGSSLQEKQTIEKQQRLQEVLKGIAQLFKRLHVCWEKCQENTSGMEYTQIETLIPLKDERDIKSELEKKRGDSYRQALEEHNELVQQLTIKNRHLKEIIDQMRNIIWEINTMIAVRE